MEPISIERSGRKLTIEQEGDRFNLTLENEWYEIATETVSAEELRWRMEKAAVTGDMRVYDTERFVRPLMLLGREDILQIVSILP